MVWRIRSAAASASARWLKGAGKHADQGTLARAKLDALHRNPQNSGRPRAGRKRVVPLAEGTDLQVQPLPGGQRRAGGGA